jgi:hypothetical protein
MSNKNEKTDFPSETFKNESARQRWELFHRAITYAKESNNAALNETDTAGDDTESAATVLTIVR